MILGLCLASLGALVWLITALPARPETRPGHRVARVWPRPERATRQDLSARMRATLPAAEVQSVLDRAEQRGLAMPLLWSWTERFGAQRLALAIDAEVAEASMRRHLERGTAPDWRAMGILAALAQNPAAGIPAAELLDPDSAPQGVDSDVPDLADWTVGIGATAYVDLSGFENLPPISGPARLSAPSREWDPDEVTSQAAPEEPPRRAPRGRWPLAS